jgi:hypothetical protein
MDGLWQRLEDTPIHGGPFSVRSIILSLVLALVLGQVLAWVYRRTYRGVSYSRSYVQSLILVTVIIAALLSIIGNNIIAAFGMLGALAIIRFRHVVKDIRDIAFLLCALVVGLATGSHRYLTAVLGTGGLSSVLLYLAWTDFGSHEPQSGFVRFRLRGPLEPDHPVHEVLRRYCGDFTLVSVEGGVSGEPSEYAFRVLIRDTTENEAFLSELEKVEGLENVRLITEDQLLDV